MLRVVNRSHATAQLLSQTSGIADYYEEQGPDGKSGFDLFVADQGRA